MQCLDCLPQRALLGSRFFLFFCFLLSSQAPCVICDFSWASGRDQETQGSYDPTELENRPSSSLSALYRAVQGCHVGHPAREGPQQWRKLLSRTGWSSITVLFLGALILVDAEVFWGRLRHCSILSFEYLVGRDVHSSYLTHATMESRCRQHKRWCAGQKFCTRNRNVFPPIRVRLVIQLCLHVIKKFVRTNK